MTDETPGQRHKLSDDEAALLRQLRAARRKQLALGGPISEIPLTVGQSIADTVAAGMGSWRFIIIQSTLLF
ncbi:MAG: hypothetical protein ACXWI5_06840, partial [Croceibacterium sp.]